MPGSWFLGRSAEVQQKILELSQLPSTAAAAGDYGNVRYLASGELGRVSWGEKTWWWVEINNGKNIGNNVFFFFFMFLCNYVYYKL